MERVLAAGGDGTAHEVANGLLQAPPAADGATVPALGTIPIGTGNDFTSAIVCGSRKSSRIIASATTTAYRPSGVKYKL